MALSHLLLRRFKSSQHLSHPFISQIPHTLPFSSLSTPPISPNPSPPTPKPTSLSARMSFIFEQIDEIENKKHDEKDQTLHRIRAWRESKKQQKNSHSPDPAPNAAESDSVGDLKSELAKTEALMASGDAKKEVELVHPWAEWIELMERLMQHNYFDHKRKDEEGMMEGLGIDLPVDAAGDDRGLDFTRDFRTVQAAVVNFGRDRFDILRSLSRPDLQILVGYGCPSADKRVAYSAKLLRKHVHLDEGDVCSSCSLRSSCEKAYLLTNKEDEARTIDVMRILLAYGFDPIDGSVTNKPLLKMKSVKTVVRKLLHQVVKLSAVPIDPNLPPPVIKKPPPKVKQPPPPKKRVGRNDVEMKKGDWLCQKCDFMNFAKNTICLQCDAKRPKRQLLPGEWECPECNFLNYRRNTACFHCEHKRPPDTYPESQSPDKPRFTRTTRMEKNSDISNAWNFDFDDNESDGADVAAFEFADSRKLDEDFSLNKQTYRDNSRQEHGSERSNSRPSQVFEKGVGFNDFDEEEDDDDDVDSYELVAQNEVPKTSRIDFSELEADSESEDVESSFEGNRHAHGRTESPIRGGKKERTESPIRGGKKEMRRKKAYADSEDADVDFDTDDDLPVHPKWKSSHVAKPKQQNRRRDFDSDDDEFCSGSDDETFRSKMRGNNRRGSNEMNHVKGRRSGFKAESFSEADSDDDRIYRSDRRRDTAGPDRARKSPGARNGASRDMRNSPNRDFNRSSSPKANNNRGSRENSYRGQGKNGKDSSSSSKFQNRRQGGSFDKRGGRSNKFDNQSESHLDDERYERPRINVR